MTIPGKDARRDAGRGEVRSPLSATLSPRGDGSGLVPRSVAGAGGVSPGHGPPRGRVAHRADAPARVLARAAPGGVGRRAGSPRGDFLRSRAARQLRHLEVRARSRASSRASRVPDAFGPDETFPLTRVVGLRLGETRFRTFEAAVASGKTCVVVLGAPELKELAIEVSPVTRTVHFRPSQSREQWAAEAQASGDDAQVLALTGSPASTGRCSRCAIRQGPTRYDGTMLFSLREPRSRDLRRRREGRRAPSGARAAPGHPPARRAGAAARAVPAARLRVGRARVRAGLRPAVGSLEIEPGLPPHAAQGLIGADAWSRFFMAYDVGARRWWCSAGRASSSRARSARCERGGVVSEEACFELHAAPVPDGVDITGTVWRPLPQGAQLSLDLVGGTGACHVGLTFSPGDRGRSTHHHFPWKKLGESLPACADAFKGVTAVNLGLLEESPLPAVPGRVRLGARRAQRPPVLRVSARRAHRRRRGREAAARAAQAGPRGAGHPEGRRAEGPGLRNAQSSLRVVLNESSTACEARERYLPLRTRMPMGRVKPGSLKALVTSVPAATSCGHGGHREDRHAQAQLDRALDGLDVVHLHRGVELEALVAEELVDALARRRLAIERDEGQPGHGRHRHLALARQRVAGRQHQRQLVFAEGHDVDARARLRVGHQPEVGGARGSRRRRPGRCGGS